MNLFKSFVYPSVVLLSMVAAVLPARAESPTPDNYASMVFASTKTRVQVQRETDQARADGSIKVWSTSYNHMTAMKSLRSRDEVRAEAIVANRTGFDNVWFGEDSGSFQLARVAPAALADRVVAAR